MPAEDGFAAVRRGLSIYSDFLSPSKLDPPTRYPGSTAT